MKASALASGSSGNCFYVENNKKGILIDAGISAKQIVERLNLIGRIPENIEGIFLTHEHSDHKKGIDVFARNFNIPIFATKKTIENNFICNNEKLIHPIKNNELVNIAGMKIETFSKSHKAIDPVSFTISSGKKISIITDLGFACENSITQISESDLIFLESNHDGKMLENGPYPYFLKKWISSNTGHLSNLQSSLAVLENAKPKLKNIILSHLSEKNNTPEIALKEFNSILAHRKDLSINLNVSKKESPTKLFEI